MMLAIPLARRAFTLIMILLHVSIVTEHAKNALQRRLKLALLVMKLYSITRMSVWWIVQKGCMRT